MKTVLLVTNHVPPARIGPFAELAAQVPLLVATYGGRVRHGAATVDDTAGFERIAIRERDVSRLAASREHAAVIAATGGRVALPGAWRGSRRTGTPFLLWASLWHHPRTPAHLLARPLMRRIYRGADAVIAYGPHVAAHVTAAGAHNVHIAPQCVDNAFWGASAEPLERRAAFQVLQVGRLEAEKGVLTLIEAWALSELGKGDAALVLVGEGPLEERLAGAGAFLAGRRGAAGVRNFYASSDVLTLTSQTTRAFREPWGLVCNEAMNQSLPVIATDAVGAAAGGLVRDGETGLVVPERSPQALARALRRLAEDEALRARLGSAGQRAVQAYTPQAWAGGVLAALRSVGAAS